MVSHISVCLTGKIKCGCCGGNYIRDVRKKSGQPYREWRYGTHKTGKCSGRNIPEQFIKEKFSEVCGQKFKVCFQDFDEDLFEELISEVVIVGNDTIEYRFKDGRTAVTKWELTGNKDHWDTAAREKRRNTQRRIRSVPAQ